MSGCRIQLHPATTDPRVTKNSLNHICDLSYFISFLFLIDHKNSLMIIMIYSCFGIHNCKVQLYSLSEGFRMAKYIKVLIV